MSAPAAKMSVRQRVKEHETLLKGMAEAKYIIDSADAVVTKQRETIRRLRWTVALVAVAPPLLGALLASVLA